ncbi:MAG: hypothetical protein EZS28_016224 [Streblomastix strix]|uniref:Uncharacterized protein n=1 Tax=Streblomastix strix TaxID=222440 RepID=A0A5J4W155_9EUKA|nr:MAG: hypothetical protein EZS28_016224 [Streblomastix strix]
MEVFDDGMKEKNYTVQDIMNQKVPFIHTEFMTWMTKSRKKVTVSKAPRINTQYNAFSHIRYSISLRNNVETHYTCNLQSLDQQSKIWEQLRHQQTL